MNRGRRGETVFSSKDDYQRFIDILHESIELFSLRISAYCLMTNHYQLYRSFMAEDEDKTFLDRMNLKRLPSVLGDNPFVNSIKERFFDRKRHIEVPESKRLAPDTKDIIYAVCQLYTIDKAQLFAAKRGTINEDRNMVIYLLRYLRGDSLANIGKVFGIQSYSTVSSIIERFKVRMQTERMLLRNVERIRKAAECQGQT